MGCSMSRGRVRRARSPTSRSRRWWWPRWSGPKERDALVADVDGRRDGVVTLNGRETVGRIWQAFKLKPHLTDTFKLSSDPLFVEKVRDVVGLYLDPPERAVVLCVDALGRAGAR